MVYLTKNYSIFTKARNNLYIDVFIVIKTINEGIRTRRDLYILFNTQ